MSSVVENFRVRWFDHKNCWASPKVTFDTLENNGTIAIKSDYLGCYFERQVGNESYITSVDSPTIGNIFSESLQTFADTNDVSKDLITYVKDIDLNCMTDQDCSNQLTSTIQKIGTDAKFRLKVPIEFKKEVEDVDPEGKLLLKNVSFYRYMNFVNEFPSLVHKLDDDCFDETQFPQAASFHTEYFKVFLKPGAQTDCPITEYANEKIALYISVTNSDDTQSAQFALSLTGAQILTGIDKFYLCKESIDPASCNQWLPTVDDYDTINVEITIFLMTNSIINYKMSYAIKAQEVCFRYSTSFLNRTHMCFQMDVLPTCGLAAEGIKQVLLWFSSPVAQDYNISVQNTITTNTPNCIILDSVQLEALIPLAQQPEELRLRINIDDIWYPNIDFSNILSIKQWSTVWYGFACILVVGIVVYILIILKTAGKICQTSSSKRKK